ncbi:MAG: hypothetical protein A2600_03410 [Candidatus Lambdaproteobacteria bacterium RIFOXYD1_FULL_56_27]|uniref:HPt domain-containing protein n=1 Tax=Candidatus Lambdaproteobacteria bacterium RIFOXYD2_FULL_56_26 TaxID=1817773 RepID=A0A1F6H344_9PROT|nr:MAG: hypothetical protein A2426_11470 [Candidatus Lambdaproteobacteria bacterium RIFOXYC1_FULL_56_13]OGH04817.1 MAG: hypothetical protein A2557_07475 [Candidatus Lambdaproteobacteria bacterium RIFOXYD2_FULL_56_26]OGH09282.1 MAG: hypothetical protein A2600_03410 [Candidatus Lambdaproteobacteria bacterium RIFOXYD1_FULL_56_27]
MGLKILVGEDSHIDKLVLERFLRFSGYQACWAEDRPGVNRCLTEGHFDLILLSLQLPGIEPGFVQQPDLKFQIAQNALWVATGQQKNLVGLETGGWFEYLSKPLDIELFQNCLRRASLLIEEQKAPKRLFNEHPTTELDLVLLESRRQIDPDLVTHLIEIFFLDAPPMLESLKSSALSQNFPALVALTHKFKGMTGNVGAKRMSEIIGQIERQAQNHQKTALSSWIALLEESYQTTLDEFRKLIGELKG